LYKLCDVLEAMIHRFQTGECPYPIALMLDTLKDTFTGDENQRWQVDAVIKHLWGAILACVRDAGGPPIGIVFTHHMTRSGSRSVMEGKGNATAAFAASGSIGIDANSRRITQLAQNRQDGNLVQACVTKNNNGPTGVVTWWRRVPSPDGSTVHLAPSAGPGALVGVNAFKFAPAIAKLHAYATSVGAPLISHGMRKTAAAMPLDEALQRIGFSLDPGMKGAFVQAAVDAGAFRSGQRGKRNGKPCETVLKPVPGWIAPQDTGDDIIDEGAA
ncbi:hypothetical protein WDZ92_45995, partial [Nostoc sp. NIES-2111]